MKKCNLYKLLEETPETYYWVGFILADGHISNGTRLRVTLAKKDKDHLVKLQKFLQIENMTENDQVHISGMDSKVIKNFVKKFDIKSNKTIYPPNLNINNKKLLFALSIGFIDGDGSIKKQYKRNDCILRIKCHANWLNVIKYLFKNEKVKINNQGYVNTNIANNTTLKNMKLKAIKLNLPIMNRKWDLIDLSYITKYEKSKINTKKVIDLYLNQYRQKDICEITNLSKGRVSIIIKNFNEKYKYTSEVKP